jgi:Glycosyl hydrolase family 26
VVGALFLALLALVVVPATAGADPMYWGGTIKGDVWGIPGEVPTSPEVVKRFEQDAGKKLTMVNTGQGWAQFNPTTMNAAIAIGAIPLVTMKLENASIKEVIEGKQDPEIRSWAKEARAFGYPFLFRPWWEPNGNWYPWARGSDTPTEYIEAWQHFHDLVEEEGATNVTWDWVVNAIWGDPESNPTPWYPGDEYVDWVGVDAYNWGKNPIQPATWLTAEQSIEPTLEILEEVAPGKPVCVCESASTEYDESGQPPKPLKKAAWLHEMLDTFLPTHPEIKAYLYFDWNVEKEGGQVKERFDWPIESSPEATEAFREVIAAPDYLSVRPPLTKLAKVPMPVLPPPPQPEMTEPVVGGGTPTGGTEPTGVAPNFGGSTGKAATTSSPSGPTGSTRIAFGAPRLQPSSGTARLPPWIPGAGRLEITAHGAHVSVASSSGPTRPGTSRRVAGTERLILQVSAMGSRRQALQVLGKTKVTVLVRFTPTGGTPTQRRLTFTLRAHSWGRSFKIDLVRPP